jgi:ankyrin repeat protein
MASIAKKRRYPAMSSPNESDDDKSGRNEHWDDVIVAIHRFRLEQASGSVSQVANKRRGSVAAEFASHRLIVSERQQMAVLKQLTAGEESNSKISFDTVSNTIENALHSFVLAVRWSNLAGSQSPSSIALHSRPSKINRRNEHGETIVHIAARKGDLKQLKKVLKAGANVNEADNAGITTRNTCWSYSHVLLSSLSPFQDGLHYMKVTLTLIKTVLNYLVQSMSKRFSVDI